MCSHRSHRRERWPYRGWATLGFDPERKMWVVCKAP